MDEQVKKEKLILQWVLMGLMGYEVTALQSQRVSSIPNIPTITHLLQSRPKWVSSSIIGTLVLALIDHIYFQKVLP